MRRSAASTARVSRWRRPNRKNTKNPTTRFSADEANTQRSRKSPPRCGSALAELHPRRADPDIDGGVDHRVFPHLVDLQHLPAAPASTGGAAGGASRLCSRPQLHLGAAHPGAAADVRHTDHHGPGPDHDAADQASHDDNAAAVDSAACAAAAVRARYDDPYRCAAGPGSGAGACTWAATAARPARPARMTRPASSARRVIGTHAVHGYTGDP